MKISNHVLWGYGCLFIALVIFFFSWVETKQTINKQFDLSPKTKSSSVTHSMPSYIVEGSTNWTEYLDSDGETRIVFKPKTEGKQSPLFIAYEIDYDYPPETSEGLKEKIYAFNHGARGKIT